MLHKLRRRFLLDTMIVALIILIGSNILLIIATNTFQKNSAEDAMSAALQNITELTVHRVPAEDGTVTVAVDEDAINLTEGMALLVISPDGELLYEKSPSRGVEERIQSDWTQMREVLTTAEDGAGVMAAQSFRFEKEPLKNVGSKVSLYDRTGEQRQLYFQLRMYVVLAFIITILVLIVSDILARRAIQPVDEAILAQQQFIADASHELKTPLTVILANLDIISASPDATVRESEKWLDNTKSEAKRMSKLVNEMLFLARSDAAMDMNYNFRLINFNDVVDEVVLTTEALAFERNITLESDIPETSQVVGDYERLKQVVMILVENAFKYVDENGTITVRLSSSSFRSEVLNVINTGTPIPEERATHIFDRFYRAEESRAREKGGYGLGLSIASNIVDKHNGEIGLDYSDERGTCFTVRLPNAQNLRAPDLSEPTET